MHNVVESAAVDCARAIYFDGYFEGRSETRNYCIKNGYLLMCFSAIPVPRTTLRKGSSAI